MVDIPHFEPGHISSTVIDSVGGKYRLGESSFSCVANLVSLVVYKSQRPSWLSGPLTVGHEDEKRQKGEENFGHFIQTVEQS